MFDCRLFKNLRRSAFELCRVDAVGYSTGNVILFYSISNMFYPPVTRKPRMRYNELAWELPAVYRPTRLEEALRALSKSKKVQQT